MSPPNLGHLKAFVRRLNEEHFPLPSPRPPNGWDHESEEYGPTQIELYRLVTAWRDSGPNVSKLFQTESGLVVPALNIRAMLMPTGTSQGKLVLLEGGRRKGSEKARLTAFDLFLGFLLNPFNQQLGGPCARCGRYFVKKTKRTVSIYCTAKCGNRSTSKLANQKRRLAEREERIATVRRAIRDWQNAKSRVPWKEWVSKKTLVSKNWITRALRSGEILEPRGIGT